MTRQGVRLQKTATKRSEIARFLATVALHREKVAERIVERRDELGLTQQDVADRVGVRVRQVQRWEAGESLGRLENLQSLAEALDTTVGELMAGIEDVKPGPPSRDRIGQLEDRITELERHLGTRFDQMAEQLLRLTREGLGGPPDTPGEAPPARPRRDDEDESPGEGRMPRPA